MIIKDRRGVIDMNKDKFFLQEQSQLGNLQALSSLSQGAAYLNIAEISLRRLVEAKKISYRRVGRRILFDKDTLLSYGKISIENE